MGSEEEEEEWRNEEEECDPPYLLCQWGVTGVSSP